MIPLLQFLLLAACTACAAGLGIYWGVIFFHVLRTVLDIPTARRGLRGTPDPGPRPSVCVVIPAHNEESVIAHVARSLLAQDYPDLRIVFSLDRCTDATAQVLRDTLAGDERTEVIEVRECPPDWAGKVHAIWRGVEDSRVKGGAHAADLLLFIDADTVLDPACIRACVALLEERRLGMLSLLSTLTNGRWFEKVAQPAAAMELIRQYPIRRANSPSHRRPFANGQFMLFRRGLYEAIGGHAAVHDAILEDIQLARRVAHRPGDSGRAGLFFADGLLHCRMYGSWPEFRRGWKRIYIESANRRPARMRRQARCVRLLGVLLPAACWVGVAAGALWLAGNAAAPVTLGACALALVMWLGAVAACYAAGGVPLHHIPAYPLGAWLTAAVLREAAADLEQGKAVPWGGREYRLQARE